MLFVRIFCKANVFSAGREVKPGYVGVERFLTGLCRVRIVLLVIL